MPYKFYTVDVFTERLFGGNPLAVFPHAQGLDSLTMQKIAAEFNLSETTFVLPPDQPQACRKVRIFTPKTELPFAGHPTLGTAYLLGAIGAIDLPTAENLIYLEEEVGLIAVKVLKDTSNYTELTVSQEPVFRADVPSLSLLASMLSLEVEDLSIPNYRVVAVSCGLPFLCIPVRNGSVLAQAQLQTQLWASLLANSWANCLYLFCFTPEDSQADIHVRMFAPSLGIVEDPATGSGAAALGAYLGKYCCLDQGNYQWQIAQGKEIGRPSSLKVKIELNASKISKISVGGSAILVSEGVLYI